MLARLQRAGAIDAVHLDLHGAMVTEHLDDGEGEILARVRKVVGSRVPIVASLDLHANVTARDDGTRGRTGRLPHLSPRRHGRDRRACRKAARAHARGGPPARQGDAPARFPHRLVIAVDVHRAGAALYELLERLEHEHDTLLSFTPGFPMADFPECQMAVFGYGPDPARVQRAVDALAGAIHDAEPEFALELYAPDEAVARAAQRGEIGATRGARRHAGQPGGRRQR